MKSTNRRTRFDRKKEQRDEQTHNPPQSRYTRTTAFAQPMRFARRTRQRPS